MNNVQPPIVPQHDVVIVKDLDAYQSHTSEILILGKQLTKRWLKQPDDTTIIEHLKRIAQSSTAFFVLQHIDTDTIRIVGMAILNTINTIADTEGYISGFTILNHLPIGITTDLRHLLTSFVIDHARSLGMVEISYNRDIGDPNKPDCECFAFRNTSGHCNLNLVD